MKSIISFLINTILIISFSMFTLAVNGQDADYWQIDYAANIAEADVFAFLVPTEETATEEIVEEIVLEENLTATPLQEISVIKNSNITPPKTRQMHGRESITFILGKYTETGNPFYDEAFYYFSNHPYDQTEYIVTTCRSLLDVRNYLAAYPTYNALPWSTINIVMSPTESNNLRVPIFPQGVKSDAKNLEMIAMQKEFPGLTSNQIDQWTSLYIHGAEVKKDTKLNYALHRLLFAQENMAINPIFLNDSFTLEYSKL